MKSLRNRRLQNLAPRNRSLCRPNVPVQVEARAHLRWQLRRSRRSPARAPARRSLRAFGTDWDVAPLNPMLGLYAAVTRATLDGKNPGGWFPEQKLTVEEAVEAYTMGSAYAEFQEKEKGSITPGKLADMVLLSDDIFSIDPVKIRDVKVLKTIVGGKVVWNAAGAARHGLRKP